MELKYKAQRIDNNEFITGCLIIDEITDKHYIALSIEESEKTGEEGCLRVVSCEVKKETVSTQTGVKDINKKESYLGDIVKKPVPTYGKLNEREKISFGIIKKEKNSNNMYVEWNYKSSYDGKTYWGTNKLGICLIEEFEIVENIFENEDMIKKEV